MRETFFIPHIQISPQKKRTFHSLHITKANPMEKKQFGISAKI